MQRRVRLQTPRLNLRSWAPSDADRFHEACNTPEVMRWLGGTQTRAELREDVAYFAAFERREHFTFWVVERVRDKAFLGFVGIIILEEDDCPFAGEVEIGWRLREDVWRRGYGYEAAAAVLDHAFRQLGLLRVVSRTAKQNIASIALMRKLGMKRDLAMDYRPRAAISKLAVFTILREQWEDRLKRSAARTHPPGGRHKRAPDSSGASALHPVARNERGADRRSGTT